MTWEDKPHPSKCPSSLFPPVCILSMMSPALNIPGAGGVTCPGCVTSQNPKFHPIPSPVTAGKALALCKPSNDKTSLNYPPRAWHKPKHSPGKGILSIPVQSSTEPNAGPPVGTKLCLGSPCGDKFVSWQSLWGQRCVLAVCRQLPARCGGAWSQPKFTFWLREQLQGQMAAGQPQGRLSVPSRPSQGGWHCQRTLLCWVTPAASRE